MADEVLVATVIHPERRFRIAKTRFDEVNAKAEKAGRDSPFIVQEEGCEGPVSFDGLSKTDQKKEIDRQAEKQAEIDAAEDGED